MSNPEKIYFFGLDVHKDYSTYAIMDKEGNLFKEGNISNNQLSSLPYLYLLKMVPKFLLLRQQEIGIQFMILLKRSLIKFFWLILIKQK